jgi:hypothetical protein
VRKVSVLSGAQVGAAMKRTAGAVRTGPRRGELRARLVAFGAFARRPAISPAIGSGRDADGGGRHMTGRREGTADSVLAELPR